MAVSIFSKLFLDEHIGSFQLSSVVGLKQKRAIIRNWTDSLSSNKITYFKEEEVKSRFIMEFFGDVLGFNYKNPGIWLYREELKSTIDATKPDAALGVFQTTAGGIKNEVHVVVEMKGTDTFLDEKQSRPGFSLTPVDQAFLYSGKTGGHCKWVVVSNFKEIRFYHHSDQGAYQSYLLEELLQEEKLKELLFLFQKEHWTHSEISVTDKLYHLRERVIYPKQLTGHIVDQLYTALEKFEGLEFIDPTYIANLRPFNILDDYVWHYSQNILYTLNPAIHELLPELSFNEKEIVVSDQLKDVLEKAGVIDHLHKLRYTFRRLRQFLISEIYAFAPIGPTKLTGKGDLSGKLPYIAYLQNLPKIQLKIPSLEAEVCDCINCNYRSLDFRKLIEKLNAAKHNDSLTPKELAYGHYLIASENYKTSYYLHRDAENTYKGIERKNIEYFLAKINISYLHNLLATDSKESKEILSAIKSIDLDRSIHNELDVYVDEDVRKYLIKIKDFELFNRIEKKIAALVEDLAAVKRTLDANGRYSGPDHLGQLIHQYHLLYSHFHKNYLIYDAFTDFKKAVTNVMRGLLISHQTRERGIKLFPEYYLTEAILYVPRKDLQEMLVGIQVLKISEDDKDELVLKAVNFLTAFYDAVGPGSFINYDMQAQLLNWDFGSKYENSFSNLFTILSRVELSAEQTEKLVVPIFNVVKLERIMTPEELGQLGFYLEKHGGTFKRYEIIELLAFMAGKLSYGYRKYELLMASVCKAYLLVSPDQVLTEKNIVRRAVENLKDDHGRFYTRDLLDLFWILDEEGKNYIRKEILDHMEKDFEPYWYEQLLFQKVLSWKDRKLFSRFVEHVNRTKFHSDPIFLENGTTKYNNLVMVNFVSVYCFCTVPENAPVLNTLIDLTPFANWAIFPSRYDYTQFDVRWIKEVNYKHVMKRLSKIKQLAGLIKKEVEHNYDAELAEIYFRYFSRGR